MKKSHGYEYGSKAIRRAIKRVGDYERFVTFWADIAPRKIVINYKIDKNLPEDVIYRLRKEIELEAGALNFDVSMQ